MEQGQQLPAGQQRPLPRQPLAAQLGDASFDPQHRRQGRGPHQADQGGIHQGNLLLQPGFAGGELGRRGLAVIGRAALEGIGDVHIAAGIEPRLGQQLIEQLA